MTKICLVEKMHMIVQSSKMYVLNVDDMCNLFYVIKAISHNDIMVHAAFWKNLEKPMSWKSQGKINQSYLEFFHELGCCSVW